MTRSLSTLSSIGFLLLMHGCSLFGDQIPDQTVGLVYWDADVRGRAVVVPVDSMGVAHVGLKFHVSIPSWHFDNPMDDPLIQTISILNRQPVGHPKTAGLLYFSGGSLVHAIVLPSTHPYFTRIVENP